MGYVSSAISVLTSITSIFLTVITIAILPIYLSVNFYKFSEHLIQSTNGTVTKNCSIIIQVFGYLFMIIIFIMIIMSFFFKIFDYKIGYFLTLISIIFGIVILISNALVSVHLSPTKCSKIRSLIVDELTKNNSELGGLKEWSAKYQCYVLYECLDTVDEYVDKYCSKPFNIVLTLELVAIGFIIIAFLATYITMSQGDSNSSQNCSNEEEEYYSTDDTEIEDNRLTST